MGGSSGIPPRSRTRQEAEAEWPSDALQVMKAQLRLLRGEEEEQESGDGGGGGSGGGGGGPAGWASRTKNVSIDLQVQPALPHGWEQFLDLNTGEVYYIDWSTCKRTRRDPRELLRTADAKVRALSQELQRRYYSATSFSASSTSAASVAGLRADEDEATSTLCCCSSSSCLPGEQPVDDGGHAAGDDGGGAGDVMVALGCHRCLMYYMLPSSDPSCPGCGALLQVKTS